MFVDAGVVGGFEGLKRGRRGRRDEGTSLVVSGLCWLRPERGFVARFKGNSNAVNIDCPTETACNGGG